MRNLAFQHFIDIASQRKKFVMYYSTSNNIMIFDKTLDLAVVSNRSIRPIGNHGGCHRHLLSDGSTGSDYNETFPKLRPHHLKGVSLQ